MAVHSVLHKDPSTLKIRIWWLKGFWRRHWPLKICFWIVSNFLSRIQKLFNHSVEIKNNSRLTSNNSQSESSNMFRNPFPFKQSSTSNYTLTLTFLQKYLKNSKITKKVAQKLVQIEWHSYKSNVLVSKNNSYKSNSYTSRVVQTEGLL